MNAMIKMGLGIALALPLSMSTPIIMVKDAYGNMKASSSHRSLETLSTLKLVSFSPMSGEQLDAIQGMAGICISCLEQALGQQSKISAENNVETRINQLNQFEGEGPVNQGNQANVATGVNQLNQFEGEGPVSQSNQAMVNQTMINQTFSPSRQQLSEVRIQPGQALATELSNDQLAMNLAQEIRTSTQEIINQRLLEFQNLSQSGQIPLDRSKQLAGEIRISTQETINQRLSDFQNLLQSGQIPLDRGKRLAGEIRNLTQGIINEVVKNGTVSTRRNQPLMQRPNGGFVR